MRIWVALVVAAGCSRPAAPGPPPYVTPPAKLVEPLPTVQRPAFSLTFLLAGLPPPLTHVPSLAPVLQVPPFWPAVCDRRRVVLADEVLDYIFAWCRSRSGDLDHLADTLARARSGTDYFVREAAAEDLANLAADGTAVQLDPRVVEYLAAVHVFHDDPKAALGVLEPPRWPRPPPENCQRTLLRVLVAFDRATFERLSAFGGCTRDADLLMCAGERALRPAKEVAEQDTLGGMCGGRAMTDAEIRRVRLAEVYWRWRPDEPSTWMAAIRAAVDAMGDVPGSEELAVSMLELAASTQCRRDVHPEANDDVKRVSSTMAHDPRYDERLTRIAKRLASCI